MRRKREVGGGSELIDFLNSQRWFGEKGHDILEARVRDVIPIEFPNSKKKFAVIRIDVTTDQGTSTYQLFSPRAQSAEPEAAVDALEDSAFRRGLADIWTAGAEFEGEGARWIVESLSRAPLVVPRRARIELSRGEQTNSSVILGREGILKLFRKLEPGPHPDVEVTRFLTIERQFVNVPVLMGTIRFEDASGRTMAGMLQEYVQGATDAWTYALERMRAELRTDGKKAGPSFETDAEQLGRVIRALHESLASGDPGGDFDLRPATKGDVLRWAQGADETVGRAADALERALASRGLPHEVRDDATKALALLPRIRTSVAEIGEGIATDAGGNTRTHGDLHLGQILRSASGEFLVIDFEGEPARPLAERRARSSPLRDVAGMLRSFAYAAAVGSGKALGSGLGAVKKRKAQSAKPKAQDAEPRAAAWHSACRQAFLRGYFAESAGRPGLLPRSRANADRLIALFEYEKLCYELVYELAHRPDWVWVPLRDITAAA